MLSDEQQNHFDTFGFLLLRQAFAADEIKEIEAAAEELWERDREGRPRGEAGQALREFVEQSRVLTQMIEDERISGAVEELLGLDYLWAGSEGNVTVNSALGWHADRPAKTGSDLDFVRLKINMYLDPVTKDTGALRVLPGSHKPGFHLNLAALQGTHDEKGETDPLATPYGVKGPDLPSFAFESTPGDIVFFNQSLFHAVFNGFAGRRYIALKLAAHPTSEKDIDVLKETQRFPRQPHSAFAASGLPRVHGMASRHEALASRFGA